MKFRGGGGGAGGEPGVVEFFSQMISTWLPEGVWLQIAQTQQPPTGCSSVHKLECGQSASFAGRESRVALTVGHGKHNYLLKKHKSFISTTRERSPQAEHGSKVRSHPGTQLFARSLSKPLGVNRGPCSCTKGKLHGAMFCVPCSRMARLATYTLVNGITGYVT